MGKREDKAILIKLLNLGSRWMIDKLLGRTKKATCKMG